MGPTPGQVGSAGIRLPTGAAPSGGWPVLLLPHGAGEQGDSYLAEAVDILSPADRHVSVQLDRESLAQFIGCVNPR